MSLALVICVRDDQCNMLRVLGQAQRLNIFSQIIIVDDASQTPVRLSNDDIGPVRCPFTLLRHDQVKGAGAARNLGLAWVRTEHMIFFDSDDLFTNDIVDLWHDLQGVDFDFCLMRYHDSERSYFGGIGQTLHDEACWRRAGYIGIAPCLIGDAALWSLAEANNFPWNKIYRTDFLRSNGIGCTETQVHNDIALHWHSFAAARRVLVSDRIGAIHVTAPGGHRLTNRRGKARLDLFLALTHAAKIILGGDCHVAKRAFLRFCAGVLSWGERMINPAFKAEFAKRRRLFLRNAFTVDLNEVLLVQDPVLALELTLMMAADPRPC